MAGRINMNVDIKDINSSNARQFYSTFQRLLEDVKPKDYCLNDETYDVAMKRATEEEMKLIQYFFINPMTGTVKHNTTIKRHLEDYLKFHPYMYPFVVSVAETIMTGLKDRDMSKVEVKKDEYGSLSDSLNEFGVRM